MINQTANNSKDEIPKLQGLRLRVLGLRGLRVKRIFGLMLYGPQDFVSRG